MRARDSQRQRLYDAEYAIGRGLAMPEIEDMEAYLERITRTCWFVDRWGNLDYDVHDGRRRSSAGGQLVNGAITVWMPRWSRYERVLLHEVAHALTRSQYGRDGIAFHGWQFASIFLDLVRHYMGRAEGEALKASYRRHRVRYRAPRQGRKLTTEERAAACRRLEAARAVKATAGRETS